MTNGSVREGDPGSLVDVWVVPGASRSEVVGLHDGMLKLRVIAPPEGGRANDEARRLLEGLLGAPVILIRGMSNRHKVFQVADGDAENVRRKLGLL